ncbi:MAG: hypothetical protein ACYTEL_17675 [Planctomycetota bacterium]|jgi:cell division protein FtsB
METITENGKTKRLTTIPEYAALKGVTVDKVEDWVKDERLTTFDRQGQTVIDVDASEKPAEQREEDANEETQVLPSQVLLEKLLVKAEVSAEQNELSRKKWQLISLVSMMLLAAAALVVIFLYLEVNALTAEQGRLRMDKHTLAEQADSAQAEVEQLNRQIQQLQNQSDRLAANDAAPLGLNESPETNVAVARPSTNLEGQFPAQYEPAVPENILNRTEHRPKAKTRLKSIQDGVYPENMTQDELLAALGEPDRVYEIRDYEQLLYFDRSPGRFWFENGLFRQASE